MGNIFSSKPKKSQKKPKDVFERGKLEVQKRIEEIKENADPANKRKGRLEPSSVLMDNTPPEYVLGPHTSPPDSRPPTVPPAHVLSYNDMAMNDMRYQLNHDADAFLLNNILLSVQFFENYEREVLQINKKPIAEEENLINDAMIRYNKHVFFSDRLLERVSEHVNYQRNRSQIEPLASQKLYVIYDNVEAREPGDTADYSAALDAPFYKLRIEDCKDSGYLKLEKQEVLESYLHKNTSNHDIKEVPDSGNEFCEADENFTSKDFSLKAKPKIKQDWVKENDKTNNINSFNLDSNKYSSVQLLTETKLINQNHNAVDNIDQDEAKPKKSILKKTTEFSAATRYIKAKDRGSCHHNNNFGEESEHGSSGYESILSGGSSITDSAVPKRIELHANYASSSGVLSSECWTAVVKKLDNETDDEDENIPASAPNHLNVQNTWSDEDYDETIDSAYKASRTLHKQCYYLNSVMFMNNFIVNFKQDLGSGLGFSQDAIRNSMTHGASIYCDSFKDFLKTGYEIIPGLTAPWPNAANPWIIRERKIIQNPRNNYKYQWPVKDMVSKARDYGCLLVPFGYRAKLGSNPEQKLQWKITFPAAERYLESLLAHSHVRCYLFTLALHKAFMENEMMIGIDASHIKNHLFWQCEDNFAKWPEDRLGESLRLFLKKFYKKFGKSRLPNYFMERCNEFESIPDSVLSLLQRKLKDILEAPVMHMLYAVDKLKYTSIGFYPTLNCQRLYDILTCKNPLHLSNSNLSAAANSYEKNSGAQRKKIYTNIKLPKRLETERRHLVLKFFIPHFIAMARSSEKFDAINQAMIYLEQARRLCRLLLDEPGGDTSAEEYLEIIRDKLDDCQRKKAKLDGFELPPRQKNTDSSVHSFTKQPPTLKRVDSRGTLNDEHGIPPITIADIHLEKQQHKDSIIKDNGIPPITIADIHWDKQNQIDSISEDSGIPPITIADIHLEKQQKDSVTEDYKMLTNSFADVPIKEKHIQVMDSVIEESYL